MEMVGWWNEKIVERRTEICTAICEENGLQIRCVASRGSNNTVAADTVAILASALAWFGTNLAPSYPLAPWLTMCDAHQDPRFLV